MEENTPTKDMPQESFEPLVRQPIELEYLLSQELVLCFKDLDGTHEFQTCYGDICKTVNALQDYARILEKVCEQWNLIGFQRAVFEYHAQKMREIAGKLQTAIGYDYDAAIEKCRQKKKQTDIGIGEDALVLAFKRNQADAKPEQEDNSGEADSPWEETVD